MDNIPKKQLKKYYRDIRRYLLCERTKKRALFHALKNDIEAFLIENPSADMEALYQQFGTAKDVAEAYMEEMPQVNLIRSIKGHKTIHIITTLLIVAILTFTISLIYYVRQHSNDIVEITIEYEE